MDEATSGDNRVPYSITNNAKLNPLSLKSDHDPLLFVPSGRRTNRRQKRQWILTAFIGVLCVAVAATVIQAVYFSADLPSAITIPNVLLDSLPEWKISSNATLSSTSSPALAVIEDDDDNPLIKIFQAAGVNMEDLSEKNVANLPIVYREMKRMYGSNNMREPVVWGMHTCEEYRNKVPRERRYTATAGLFNTGTNAMEFHLRKNLQVSSRWQVPWGKHRVAAVRLKHTAPGMTKMNQEDALPIVMVRDPYHWMQSMCKARYAAKWKNTNKHCPNLVPTANDLKRFHKELNHSSNNFNVTIFFDKDQVMQWDSLVHLYNDWYRQYLVDADYPRLLVRYEDMLLHAPVIMQKIADCTGTEVADQFVYQITRSKMHGSNTDFVKAILKSGDPHARLQGLTADDLEYAAKHLDAELMRVMQYSFPQPLP